MGIEIERKFLIANDSWRHGAIGVPYAQGYLSRGTGRTVRVRIAEMCIRDSTYREKFSFTAAPSALIRGWPMWFSINCRKLLIQFHENHSHG